MSGRCKTTSVVVAILVLATLGGCQTGDKANSQNGVAKKPNDTALFAQPEIAVETFFRAAATADIELLSRCFAPNCEEEFNVLREKTATEEHLKELADLVAGATIGKAEVVNEAAYVPVKFSDRDEEIELVRTDSGWKIVGF